MLERGQSTVEVAGSASSVHDILRVMTCGAVDDGKSTLIGRLMVDAGLVPEDELAAVSRASQGVLDVSLLLDGLSVEREQGITVDVAYRYLTLGGRRLIVADCPGHEQFTRNMAVGASVSDLALLIVDATKGPRSQTRRHASIAALMGIRDIVLAVNKMDLVERSGAVFTALVSELHAHADQLGVRIQAIPVSALDGDNIVRPGEGMSWYHGPTVFEVLQNFTLPQKTSAEFRFPVQRVARCNATFRGYQGTVSSGQVRRGDSIVALPGGTAARVERILLAARELEAAEAGAAVTLVLADDIEAGRGTVFAHAENAPPTVDTFVADVVCVAGELTPTSQILLRTRNALVPASISAIRHRLDVVRLSREPAQALVVNDIGRVVVLCSRPVPIDRYEDNRDLGCFLLIDRLSNDTLAAGMVTEPMLSSPNVFWQKFDVHRGDRAIRKTQLPAIVWLTGQPGAGKSTLANEIELLLVAQGFSTYVLDGDNVRHGLNRDLGYSDSERRENIRRLAEVARILADAGLITIVAAISPFGRDRDAARAVAGDIGFYEGYVDTPLQICVERDPKGLYQRALAGKLKDVTGVSSPYEPPTHPDLHLSGTGVLRDEARKVIDLLIARGHVADRWGDRG